jgi:hypothetical protein
MTPKGRSDVGNVIRGLVPLRVGPLFQEPRTYCP